MEESRTTTIDPATVLDIDELAGHIAAPVRTGDARLRILTAAAEQAEPERAVAMLAEAAAACFFAGNPSEILSVAERAWGLLPSTASVRTRFMAAIAIGMARVVEGSEAAAGAKAIHKAIELAERWAELRDDLQLLPWLAEAPIFLRQRHAGRELLHYALQNARSRAAIGALPLVLNLIALDYATTDRWAVAEATYLEPSLPPASAISSATW